MSLAAIAALLGVGLTGIGLVVIRIFDINAESERNLQMVLFAEKFNDDLDTTAQDLGWK